jgi:hypothetical protein
MYKLIEISFPGIEISGPSVIVFFTLMTKYPLIGSKLNAKRNLCAFNI